MSALNMFFFFILFVKADWVSVFLRYLPDELSTPASLTSSLSPIFLPSSIYFFPHEAQFLHQFPPPAVFASLSSRLLSVPAFLFLISPCPLLSLSLCPLPLPPPFLFLPSVLPLSLPPLDLSTSLIPPMYVCGICLFVFITVCVCVCLCVCVCTHL